MLTVEEVALIKGEECIANYKAICNELKDKYIQEGLEVVPEKIIMMAMTILSHWYKGSTALSQEEIDETIIFLQKVITYTVRNQKFMEIEN